MDNNYLHKDLKKAKELEKVKEIEEDKPKEVNSRTYSILNHLFDAPIWKLV